MIRLNRTTEYGLMALRHMNRKSRHSPTEVTSAREVADSYGLPFEMTAKTLQRLKEKGLIQSAYGAKGGYTLLRALHQISLAEFLELMEGPQSLVACSESPTDFLTASSLKPTACEYDSRCEMKQVMNHLNSRIFSFLSGIHLAELAQDSFARAPEHVEFSPSLNLNKRDVSQ